MRISLGLTLSFVLSFVLRAQESAPSSARLLPPETFVFAELHDVQRTVERLAQSCWGDMARDPEVGGFLGKLTAAVTKEIPTEARDILRQIVKIAPVGVFFAMTEIPDFQNPNAKSIPKMLFGGSYRGDPQLVDGLLAKMRGSILKKGKAKQTKETIDGTEIETFADSDFSISIVHLDKQLLVATDRNVLIEALARRAGRGARSLADTEAWQTVQKEAVTSPDGTAFFSYEALMEKLFAIGGPEAGALASMREMMPQFISISAKLDGKLMRERAYVHYRMALPVTESTHRSLAFTGEDTFAYVESVMATTGLTMDKFFDKNPLFQEASAALEKHGLTLADITQTFGPELSIVSDWETGGLAFPTVFAAVEVRDAEKARKFAAMITDLMKSEGKLTEKEHRGAKLWSIEGPLPIVQPTLALSGKHLMIGLNPGTVTAALDRAASGKSVLAETAAFTGALKTVGKTNGGLGYIDSARLVERLYDRARPFIAGFIAGNAQLSKIVEVSDLPKAAALTRHMPPFVAAFESGQHGYVVESTGPLTYFTGVVSVAFVAGFGISVMTPTRMRAMEKPVAPPEAI